MGPQALAQVLRPLAGMFDAKQYPDLLRGLESPDDAAVWRLDDERALVLIRPGGLIAVDNTLWNGNVADPGNQTEDTRAIREFNRQLHSDSRVDISLLPIGDGLTLALKR